MCCDVFAHAQVGRRLGRAEYDVEGHETAVVVWPLALVDACDGGISVLVVGGDEVEDGMEVCCENVLVVDCFEVCVGHDYDASKSRVLGEGCLLYS